jgi:hypothetical protein
MKIVNREITQAPVSDLYPHPQNPRQGDVGAIAESIQENGWYGTIVAQQGTNYILAGNHRWQAAKQLGMEEVPVTWVEVDDESALRILLADNRTSDLASHNDNVLVELLKSLESTDKGLAGTAWDNDALDNLVAVLEFNTFDLKDTDAMGELQKYLDKVRIVLEVSEEIAGRFRAIEGKDDAERLKSLLDSA